MPLEGSLALAFFMREHTLLSEEQSTCGEGERGGGDVVMMSH